jgi:hypothetical protein
MTRTQTCGGEQSDLGYQINDAADNHFTEPLDCFERFIDPSKADLAIRYVEGPDGRKVQLFAGRPSKFTVSFSKDDQRRIMRDTMEAYLAPCVK